MKRIQKTRPARALPRAVKRRPRPAGAAPALQALAYARGVFEAEANAILTAGARLDGGFTQALRQLLDCAGHVIVTGMGKPGFIAQKLSATLASTGIPSLYLHPAEALHGDLGRVSPGDVVLALSNSGATEELVRLIPALKRIGAVVIALTGDAKSPLALQADVVLDIGPIAEACPLGLVPTASSAALHAMGDALAMTLLKCRPFTQHEYAAIHPGGRLGRSVMRVADVMRSGQANPVVRDAAKLSEAVAVMTRTKGRPGATNVIDADGRLMGIFTDGDLRRLVEQGETDWSRPVREAMGRRPRVVTPQTLVPEALQLLREVHVDQLPVVDADGRCVGLLDVQDLLSARLL